MSELLKTITKMPANSLLRIKYLGNERQQKIPQRKRQKYRCSDYHYVWN